MDGLKYDSIYKFIVSLGIILIVLPFVMTYYFFNSNDVILINQEEIKNLTQASAMIIEYKQNFILNIINNINYYIIVIIIVEIVGFYFVIKGLILWNKNVQDIENKMLMLEYRISEKNYTRLSANEKKNKVKEEISLTSEQKNIKITEKTIDKYIEKENEIINSIKEVFPEYELLNDVKIGKYSVDCLVPYSYPDNLLAKAFEIKYIKESRITFKYLNTAKNKMEQFASEYYRNFKRFCLVCTLFVVDNRNNKFLLENNNILDEIKLYNSQTHNGQICKIYIADKNNIKDIVNKLKDNINFY